MTDVFISYRRRLRTRVSKLAAELEKLELDVWFDAEIVPGSQFAQQIGERVQATQAMLVCWSPDVFESDGQSSWVLAEASFGRERQVLVPVMLEPTKLPPPWNILHHEDLSEWDPDDPDSDRAAWQQTLAAIGQLVGRPGLAEFDRAMRAAGITPLRKWAQKYPSDKLAAKAWDEIERREGGSATETLQRRAETGRPNQEARPKAQVSAASTAAGKPGDKLSKWAWSTALTVAGLSTVFLLRLSGGNTATLSYHLGRFIAFFLFTGVAAYLISRKWQSIRKAAPALAFIGAAATTVVTAFSGSMSSTPDGREFFPESRVLAWMSRARTICVNLDTQGQTCEGVIKVQTITDKQVDVTMIAFAQIDASTNLKIAMPVRSSVSSRGFCTTIERPEDVVFQFYSSRDAIGVIGPNDQIIALTRDMQLQAAREMSVAGAKAGDVLCERYVVQATKDGQVNALQLVQYLNGNELRGESPMTYHFFADGAQLSLRSMAVT